MTFKGLKISLISLLFFYWNYNGYTLREYLILQLYRFNLHGFWEPKNKTRLKIGKMIDQKTASSFKEKIDEEFAKIHKEIKKPKIIC
ncbi:hypothetical protein SAMN04487911_11956 [Arenibacter nanhaiticus]|uniref:Uncharacterized protein n=1 Tax=Arenibacter nanhaiticus TaxID=558155 RepID=A0A1M6IXG5_9FLAO|nr:hypothetical protein SAMN04487911_11956 [Arenibacter nanhaiticus]